MASPPFANRRGDNPWLSTLRSLQRNNSNILL
jgi:hypothetical protein